MKPLKFFFRRIHLVIQVVVACRLIVVFKIHSGNISYLIMIQPHLTSVLDF